MKCDQLILSVLNTPGVSMNMTGHTEEPGIVVDFDVILAVTTFGFLALQEQFDTGLAGAYLGVGVKPINDLLSPLIKLAGDTVSTVIEIYAADEIIGVELKTDA